LRLDTVQQNYERSTSRNNDSEIPERSEAGAAVLEEFRQLDLEEFLNVIQDANAPAPEGESEESEEGDDANEYAFVEMYGGRDAELIPGVDYIESSKKLRMDNPECLREIVEMIKATEGREETLLNERVIELIRMIGEENP